MAKDFRFEAVCTEAEVDVILEAFHHSEGFGAVNVYWEQNSPGGIYVVDGAGKLNILVEILNA